MNDDQKKHRSELAASGYRLPDSMYVKPAIEDQASTEKTSGDGGKENADLGPDDSEHGYKGKLTSAADASKETLKRSAAAAKAARNDKDTPADVGLRVATDGHIAVGAAQKGTPAPASTVTDARSGDSSSEPKK